MYDQITANKRRTWLLIGVFIVIIAAVAWSVHLVNGTDPSVVLFTGGLISLVMVSFSYFNGDKVALSSSGAKAITKADNPYVYRMVENLCITAGIKTIPKLYIIDDPAINAFATGRDPEHSSIAVTTGAIEKLENEELEGVLAHELSHVQNYDIRVMTIVIVLVGLVSLVADIFTRSLFYGSRDSDSKGAGALAILGLVLIILSPLFAKLIQMAVSRRREYLADASGALLTRYPEGLARALEKIGQQTQPMKRANHATAHLFLESPFRTKKKRTSWFSTHPPLEDRIAKLRKMA